MLFEALEQGASRQYLQPKPQHQLEIQSRDFGSLLIEDKTDYLASWSIRAEASSFLALSGLLAVVANPYEKE